jgi:hypothetical protein
LVTNRKLIRIRRSFIGGISFGLYSHNYLSFLLIFSSFNILAFCALTIFLPVCCSIFFLVSPAISTPFYAIFLFSSNVLGLFSLLISVVVASANIFSTSSRFVILSRRFSFFNPLKFLYCLPVFPLQA